jgi:hypothetical protein
MFLVISYSLQNGGINMTTSGKNWKNRNFPQKYEERVSDKKRKGGNNWKNRKFPQTYLIGAS